MIQNDSEEDLGLLSEPLVGFDLTIVRAFEERVPTTLSGDRLLVLGGEPSVYDLSTGPWMGDVMTLIRDAHAKRAPVLGICLGAQLAAQALGGQVSPGSAPEVGFEPIQILDKADPVVGTLEGLPLFSLHHDTFTMPAGATRLAASRQYPEEGFRLGKTYGIQFHVDLSPETLARILPEDADVTDADVILEQVARNEVGMKEAARRVAAGFTAL